MKKQTILNLNAVYQSILNGDKQKTKYLYFASKNSNFISGEIKALQDAAKQSEGFVRYEKERVALAEKCCERSEDGKPLNNNNNYVFTKGKEEFDSEIKTLTEKYKEVLADRETQMKGVAALLFEEAEEIKIHKIKIEDLPEVMDPAIVNLFTEAGLIYE